MNRAAILLCGRRSLLVSRITSLFCLLSFLRLRFPRTRLWILNYNLAVALADRDDLAMFYFDSDSSSPSFNRKIQTVAMFHNSSAYLFSDLCLANRALIGG